MEIASPVGRRDRSRRPFLIERLDNAAASITLDNYSHAIPAMQEEAAALIAGLMFGERS